MKKIILTLCALILVASLSCGALATALDNLQVPSLGDVLVSHRVLLADAGDSYEEYITLFYYEGSHVLAQLNDETHFHKDAGYTLDYLKSQDYDQYYPGISNLNFADIQVTDEGDYFCVIVRFKELSVLENMEAMKASGLITGNPNDEIFDADVVAEKLIAAGMQELSMTEYGGRGLSFVVE